jgi:SNF2 family DNA or RNA helicase
LNVGYAQGTVDERINEIAKRKLSLDSAVLDDSKGGQAGAVREVLASILGEME